MIEITPKFIVRRLIDAVPAVGLTFILVAVYGGDLFLNRHTHEQEVKRNEETSTQSKPLRIAVTPAEYDDIGALLVKLGDGYKYKQIPLTDLESDKRLADYDILFFTCGKPGKLAPQVKQNLRNFVGRGGTLYASDLRFDAVADAFPEFVDPVANTQGAAQNVRAEVVDDGLRQVLGPEMSLSFEEAGWRPAAFRGADVKVILRSTIKTNVNIPITCPLLVQFPFQEGNVVFTSFHNEKQINKEMEKLLQYLIFTTVTARTQARIAKTMVSGGFSPQSQNLLSASKGNPSVTQRHYNKTTGRLKFILGFEDHGAKLRLHVEGPDGKTFEKEDTTTFTIDVPKAAVGEWKYTITAVKVPYANFPFTLTVGGEADPNTKKPIDVTAVPIDRTKGSFVFKEVVPTSAPVMSKKLRLAVTPQGSDNIGLVLRKLGEGYQYTDIQTRALSDITKLRQFDVVFVNCGASSTSPQTRVALREFVDKGGIIYASDLQFPTIQQAFPEMVNNTQIDSAPQQPLTADVLDAGLQEKIGAKMNINFNAGGWRPAAFGGEKVQILVAGEYRTNFGGKKQAPFLVKFKHGHGTVIFTAFHNSTQNTGSVIKVLEYLVFTAVTAQAQAAVNKTMESKGFFPKQEALFSHTAGNPKITRSYQNKKVQALQFALGMQAEGAKMKFTITAPGGAKYEKEVTSTLTIEAPDAPVGEWLYTVEALQVPYANFPFTVTVGEKSAK